MAQTRRADQALVERIQAKLAASKLRDERIIVKIDGDSVILEGRTAIPQHKGAATRIAKSAGAVNVVNRIQVGSRSQNTEVRRAFVHRAQPAI